MSEVPFSRPQPSCLHMLMGNMIKFPYIKAKRTQPFCSFCRLSSSLSSIKGSSGPWRIESRQAWNFPPHLVRCAASAASRRLSSAAAVPGAWACASVRRRAYRPRPAFVGVSAARTGVAGVARRRSAARAPPVGERPSRRGQT